MKKIIITICAVVMCALGAMVPAGDTWAESYDDLLKTAKDLESYCAGLGTNWRDGTKTIDSKTIECKTACAETSLTGTDGSGVRLSCDYKGVRVKQKLQLVINIISIIVAALGVVAITAVGIIYLTAGPDVGKAVKARTRLVEIIVGLVVYALIYTILNFLIPNFGN